MRAAFDRPRAGTAPRPGGMVDGWGRHWAPMMQHGPNPMATAVALPCWARGRPSFGQDAPPPARRGRVSPAPPAAQLLSAAPKNTATTGLASSPARAARPTAETRSDSCGTAAVWGGVVHREDPPGVAKAQRSVAHRRRGWRSLSYLTR